MATETQIAAAGKAIGEELRVCGDLAEARQLAVHIAAIALRAAEETHEIIWGKTQ